MKLDEKVGMYYTNLTTSEKKVYQKISKDPYKVINHTIQEISETFQVSVASIQRFVKKIGYKGYTAFQIAVEESLKQKGRDEVVNTTILDNIINAYISVFGIIKKMDLDEQMAQLVLDILTKPSVKSIGIGNTSFSANQLTYSLYPQNIFAETIDSKIKIDYLVNVLSSDMLLIIFTVTASTVTYNKLLNEARKKGTKVWLITMNRESKISVSADNTFYLPSMPISVSDNNLHMLDDRTILYCFAEIISYYCSLSNKKNN